MKNVIGGYGDDGYSSGGTCGVTVRCGGVVTVCIRGKSYDEAHKIFNSHVGGCCSDGSTARLNWCCDSCTSC